MTSNLFRHDGPDRSASTQDWQNARQELLSLVNLKANWDGEDGLPVPQKLIESAAQFFKEMERRGDPAPSSVYALAIGAIMAEWGYADRTTVSAEIREPGKAEILVWHPNRPSVFKIVTWHKSPRAGYATGSKKAWEKVAQLLAEHAKQSTPLLADLASQEVALLLMEAAQLKLEQTAWISAHLAKGPLCGQDTGLKDGYTDIEPPFSLAA